MMAFGDKGIKLKLIINLFGIGEQLLAPDLPLK